MKWALVQDKSFKQKPWNPRNRFALDVSILHLFPTYWKKKREAPTFRPSYGFIFGFKASAKPKNCWRSNQSPQFSWRSFSTRYFCYCFLPRMQQWGLPRTGRRSRMSTCPRRRTLERTCCVVANSYVDFNQSYTPVTRQNLMTFRANDITFEWPCRTLHKNTKWHLREWHLGIEWIRGTLSR